MGSLRTVGGFPLEHPFDFVKTKHQAQMNLGSGIHLNEFQIMREVYHSEGFRGFYSGFIANTARAALKNTYRYPMMIFFPDFYAWLIPDKYYRKLATGITIASLECFAITPMQRLKNYEMTRNHSQYNWGGYRKFLFSSAHGGESLLTELYRGFYACMIR
jgi:hypothetical protein